LRWILLHFGYFDRLYWKHLRMVWSDIEGR
jgi:hypothetical protein